MAIIITKNGKDAQKIEKSGFEKEDMLQQYIHENPESIPLYDIKEDTRLLILAREFETASGPIDALGIDKDGDIYIVETKLYKNPDKRKVLAQQLDYGAALWKQTAAFDEFVQALEVHVRKNFKVGLRDKVGAFFSLPEEAVEDLLDKMRTHLTDGRFRFVVLMDTLDPRLKDLISFVNQNSQFDIFAVELEFYKHEAYEIVIPKLYGAEVKKDIGVRDSERRKWDEEGFLTDAQTRLDEAEYGTVKKLFDFSKEAADRITYGTGTVKASANVKFDKVSHRSLYTIWSDGTLSLNFGWLHEGDAGRYRDEFKKALERLPNISIPEHYQEVFPNIPLEKWAPVADEFIAIIRELIR